MPEDMDRLELDVEVLGAGVYVPLVGEVRYRDLPARMEAHWICGRRLGSVQPREDTVGALDELAPGEYQKLFRGRDLLRGMVVSAGRPPGSGAYIQTGAEFRELVFPFLRNQFLRGRSTSTNAVADYLSGVLPQYGDDGLSAGGVCDGETVRRWAMNKLGLTWDQVVHAALNEESAIS
jgi:hypothetical protein